MRVPAHTHFDTDRLNKIIITIIPNPLLKDGVVFTNSERSKTKKIDEFSLAPFQVKELIIEQSYKTHLTEVSLELTRISPELASDLNYGFYIVKVSVSQEIGDYSMHNHFMVDFFKEIGNQTDGTMVSVDCFMTLKSIIRYRMEIENNIPFELGGYGTSAAQGAGVPPTKFLMHDLRKLIVETYGVNVENANWGDSIFDLTLCDIEEPTHNVWVGPSVGYKFDANTNWKALEFFFEHYPLFNTTFGWLLDDFSIASSYGTTLKITDFVWWQAWTSKVSDVFSDFFNKSPKKQESKEKGISVDQWVAAAVEKLGFIATDVAPYYNVNKFLIRDNFPKIWAVDVQTNHPIDMSSWNGVHAENTVLALSSKEILPKLIKNPIYREYFTFLTSEEIEQTQLYKNVFIRLHPIMKEYNFSNLAVGDIDLNTVIKFKKEKLELTENFGFDRYGVPFSLRRVFKQSKLPQKVAGQAGAANESQDTYVSPRYSLNTTVSYVVIDAGPLDLSVSGEESHPTNGVSEDTEINYGSDECADAREKNAVDSSHVPANGKIADEMEYIINNHFTPYSQTKPQGIGKWVDCSSFVQIAAKNVGYKNWPRNTKQQDEWLRKVATPIAWKDMQRGDIVYFDWPRSGKVIDHVAVYSGEQRDGKYVYYHSGGNEKSPTYGTSLSIHNKTPHSIFRIAPPGGNKTNPEIKKDEDKGTA